MTSDCPSLTSLTFTVHRLTPLSCSCCWTTSAGGRRVLRSAPVCLLRLSWASSTPPTTLCYRPGTTLAAGFWSTGSVGVITKTSASLERGGETQRLEIILIKRIIIDPTIGKFGRNMGLVLGGPGPGLDWFWNWSRLHKLLSDLETQGSVNNNKAQLEKEFFSLNLIPV